MTYSSANHIESAHADEAPRTRRRLPSLMKISAVCRELDCGRTQVYALIDSGHLTKVNLGQRRCPRITGESVERLINGG